MNFTAMNMKKTIVTFALAVAFLIPVGLASSSIASAQDWRWGNRDNRRDDRRRDRDDDRWRDRDRDRDHDRWDDRRDRRQEQIGFRNGLDEGREDARRRRSFSPYTRVGDRDYREGFRRGYAIGYRQNSRFSFRY